MSTGIGYSSPTLSSAIVDLTPAFTFILAIISRCVSFSLFQVLKQPKLLAPVAVTSQNVPHNCAGSISVINPNNGGIYTSEFINHRLSLLFPHLISPSNVKGA
jgi:hypothetical protein